MAREMQAQPQEGSAWPDELLQQLLGVAPFLAVLAVLWALNRIVNPVNDNVPCGPMPRLADWLSSRAPPRPPGNFGGRPPPPREARAPKGAGAELAAAGGGGAASWALPAGLRLCAVGSAAELWEAYAFATREIVEEVPSMLFERNYIVSLVLKLSSFPKVYSNWEKYESCAVEEISLGPTDTVLGPLAGEASAVPIDRRRPERELVLECGEMVNSYGLSLVARESSAGIVGTATLRVKRLPEGCHVDYDGDEDPSVVCTVSIDAVYEAAGLEAVAYLESIAVARGWRGSGLAARLLEFVEEKARTWGLSLLALHVHRDNWSALRFYQRRGFEVTSDWLGWGPMFFLLLKPL